MFGRRRQRRERSQEPEATGVAGPPHEGEPSDLAVPSWSAEDVLLAETIARHFGGSRVDGRTAWLGIGDLRVDCEVAGVQPLGSYVAASLFLPARGWRPG